jgi:hypothetical protein
LRKKIEDEIWKAKKAKTKNEICLPQKTRWLRPSTTRLRRDQEVGRARGEMECNVYSRRSETRRLGGLLWLSSQQCQWRAVQQLMASAVKEDACWKGGRKWNSHWHLLLPSLLAVDSCPVENRACNNSTF